MEPADTQADAAAQVEAAAAAGAAAAAEMKLVAADLQLKSHTLLYLFYRKARWLMTETVPLASSWYKD